MDYRAAKFKAAAAAGEGAPDNLSLPPALLARERDRDESRATVLAARAAFQSLAVDREQAEKALKEAEQLASEAAHAILVEQAISQAAVLAAAWSSVWHLADQLSALRGLPLPTQLPDYAVRLQQLIASIDHRQFAGGRNAALKRAGERWRMWHVALLRDADAEPPQFADDGASSAAVERVGLPHAAWISALSLSSRDATSR